MKFLFLLSLLFLPACGTTSYVDEAHKFSDKANFLNHPIKTKAFLLTSYERVHVHGGVANIYIEGDGRAWLNKKRPSLDPTPKDPIALKLTIQDPANNVIYLARPCQYTKTIDGSACDQKYWTSHRFAPEVLEAINAALDDIKQRHQITEFNLIGFSGGGNIAALLTARRDDVVSLRTVAGNLDHKTYNSMHKVSQMPQSLNAKDVAHQMPHIPQIHFIGSEDQIVPRQLYDSYKKASGLSGCVQSYVVDGVSHTKGWESVWKSLLNKSVDCSKL